jgi:Asp-tRNA(Asn)/Glu-tRNA(Gln) amidotransferase A subunit family amidase
MTTELNSLSATAIATGVADGSFTAEAVTAACLDHIAAREEAVGAWEFLDPELALTQARGVDAVEVKGPLAGVPFGVKDIIDTHDMPTGMGSPIYDGHRPSADASCVAQMRAAGAVILGKTVTCEFAGLTPRKTTNPHDPTRTPGGSSSGSAAAVADEMIPLAFGTQTGGSVLRPSSYCGIIGYKPSFDTFSLTGIYPAAESLDTLGLHARSLDDIELASATLLRRPFAPIGELKKPPVVGLCKTPMWDQAEPETREAVEAAAVAMQAAGAMVRDFELPEEFEWLGELRGMINGWERADVMADEWARNRDALSEQMQATIQGGLDTPYRDYVDAMHLMETCRVRTTHTFEGCDVLLTPAVDGEAPVGLAETGSPRFQALWTMLHTPSITLPTHKGSNGLPVGIQLVAPYRADRSLLVIARWVQEACK